jgi:multiple sugar transport system substrate-binding protein
LIVGTADTAPAYGAVPARAKDQGPWLDAKKKQFPWVTNWDVVTAGLAYPDSPSAEAYMPNYNESWDLAGKFYNKMINTAGLDIDAEAAAFIKDLQASFDKAK